MEAGAPGVKARKLMKLYDSIGPNPHVVKMFLAEKGLDVERTPVDLMAGENRLASYGQVNPSQTLPALELADGEVVAEITAICEYIEELHPAPPLIGSTPLERAQTRMWSRRIDLGIVEPMTNGFRYSQGLQLFEHRIHCIPQAADDLKAIAKEKLAWLDGLVDRRRAVHPGRCPALLLPGLRRPGGPAPRPGQQEPRGLARTRGGPAEREGGVTSV